MTAKIAVGIEYDGRAYAGWQTQSGSTTIQGVTEAALSSVADESISLVSA